MKKPKRIQRKRTKGWRMPPNTVYVGRPTEWGNPFKGKDAYKKYKKAMYAEYEEEWVAGLLMSMTIIEGMNLACWCSLDKPCHADVLLKIANE